MAPSDHVNRFIRKLESIATLSDDEKQALCDLPMRLKAIDADQDIVREGDRPNECCLILEGFVCRYMMLDDGRRQILSFHTPGDIPDLQSLHLKVMDHSIGTLAPSSVAFIPHKSLHELNDRYPRIAGTLWRDTLIDAAIFRLWMVGLGRKSAYERISHLLCELQMRLRAVGLTNDHSYQLPLTQSELADATGISTVHVNRVLQDLKKDGLVTFQNGSLVIEDWEGLKKAGEFDPTYLHLDPGEVT
jgi:cAMP-binding proteins - catabolite gene activator and regulatory subunit of cAMP-dependent protein kinases